MLHILRETTGRWVAAVILGLIAVTFIFWGVDFSLTSTTFAAKVNGENIPLLEFERDLQQTQNQYQQLYPVELTEDLRREIRRSVVERMVLTKALEQRAEDAGYRVSDERLAEVIRSTPAFQVGGEFSADVYGARLGSQGFSPAGYEALQRRQLELQDLQEGIVASAFLTPAEFRRYIELLSERRELAYALFAVEDFLDQVEIEDPDVTAHYEANTSLYMSPETVDLEYIELDRDTLAADIEVNDAALQEYYEERRERFETAEERRARHILVTVEGDDEAAAAAEAARILERLEAGEDFAAVAAEVSDDAGTATQGGDLGWIGRGLLAGPFEDTLFAMDVGAIAGPVRTDFGYHVIRLDEVRAGDVQSFDAVREQLAAEYQTERAEDHFYDQANRLEELAFDAYDELASVATQTGLPVQTLSGYPRSGNPDVFENNAPVVQVAFDEAAIASGNNSRLIELSDDRVMILRVTAHHPPAPLPLESVAEQIREELAYAAAEELVAAAAAAFHNAVGAASGRDPSPDADADAPAVGAASGRDPSPDVGAASGRDPSPDAPADAPNVGAASGRDPSPDAPATPSASADLEALAATHGGTWNAPRWVERSDGNVPTELLAQAFGVRAPLPDDGVQRVVPMASGDTAVMLLSAIEPGDPNLVPQQERDRQLDELADEAARSEMTGYAADVRARATVRIPDEVLNPQF